MRLLTGVMVGDRLAEPNIFVSIRTNAKAGTMNPKAPTKALKGWSQKWLRTNHEGIKKNAGIVTRLKIPTAKMAPKANTLRYSGLDRISGRLES